MNPVQLAIEAFVVGIAAVLVGFMVHVLFGYHSEHANSPKMRKEMLSLGVTLFFTGFFLHLIFEAMGWNRSYCVAKVKSSKK